MAEPPETASHAERRWAVLRVALGCAQMFGAVFSVVLLVEAGVSTATLAAVAITCLMTSLSVLLFGHPTGRRR